MAERVLVRGGVPMVKGKSKSGALYVQVEAGALDAYVGKEIVIRGFNCAERTAKLGKPGAAFVAEHKLYREDEDRSESGLVATGERVSIREQRYYFVWT